MLSSIFVTFKITTFQNQKGMPKNTKQTFVNMSITFIDNSSCSSVTRSSTNKCSKVKQGWESVDCISCPDNQNRCKHGKGPEKFCSKESCLHGDSMLVVMIIACFNNNTILLLIIGKATVSRFLVKHQPRRCCKVLEQITLTSADFA